MKVTHLKESSQIFMMIMIYAEHFNFNQSSFTGSMICKNEFIMNLNHDI
jgi:hypothetical protein